ncbi:MAG: Gfo/Idh/MocA family oxidoreductase, partial [Kiritimatiellae bacterium]|nr:Gfo/Idh/MocA family oxidoreductase [Kiritimatiellia bacterium]
MMTTRRHFLEGAMLAGGAAGLCTYTGCASFEGLQHRRSRSMAGFKADPLERVRVGIIGVGQRGEEAVHRLAIIPGVVVAALCDLQEEYVAKQAKWLSDAGRTAPATYFGPPDEWRRLCDSDSVDLVYICTPWLWHTPMAVYAMQCGKHVAVEVPAAMTIEQCWQLVDTAEETRRHCMMLENCCYGENEMLALMLCRKGILGDLVHGEAAYIHDLRFKMMDDEKAAGQEGHWRLNWLKQHTGNPYPTHGLGPVCQYMDINRGDRLDYLTSVSSAQFGLSLAAEKAGGKTPKGRLDYKLGDINTSVIRTYRGRTIMLQHDITSPRPYSRINLISGTKGILADYPLRVALEPKAHQWMSDAELTELKARHTHPLWVNRGDAAKNAGGHGGMDYLMDLRLCHC